MDLGRLGGMLKSIHHSIRMRNKNSSATIATITDNAVKDVYSHVSSHFNWSLITQLVLGRVAKWVLPVCGFTYLQGYHWASQLPIIAVYILIPVIEACLLSGRVLIIEAPCPECTCAVLQWPSHCLIYNIMFGI